METDYKELGKQSYLDNNLNKSIFFYSLAIQKDENDYEAYFWRSECYYSVYKYDLQVMDLNKCIEIKPNAWEAYEMKATALEHQMKYQQAINIIKQGIANCSNKQILMHMLKVL